MRLLRQEILQAAIRRHCDTRVWLTAWARSVDAAWWQSLSDVRLDYPSADGVKLKSTVVVTVFNVRGNSYRLLCKIDYDTAIVSVLELLTHAEYDKEKWKTRY